MHDALIVGGGPNGLAAGVILARAGLDVVLFEANETVGGGARTLDGPLPGFIRDWGAAVHPMAFASPFFRAFQLDARIPFAVPNASYAHPLDGGRAGIAWRDIQRTVDELGADGRAWNRLLGPLAASSETLIKLALSQPAEAIRHPLMGMGFGMRLGRMLSPRHGRLFKEDVAPAMISGVFAHSIGPIGSFGAVAPGLILASLAHAGGWPVPIGGTQRISDAMLEDFLLHGGRVDTAHRVTSIADLPPARAVLFDTNPAQLLDIAGDSLHPRYRRVLANFRHGNAASKVDFALSGPVPWAAPGLSETSTLHLGGTFAEIAKAENTIARGKHAESPYVLVSQPGTVDSTRAPRGHHALWAYAHVPAGSDLDMTEAITAQIERFAPGFRDTILASHSTPATELEQGNINFVGGDIAGGAVTLRQIVARPRISSSPWRVERGIYLCSASSHPGPGVHGMGGFHAARTCLKEVFGLPVPALGRRT